MLRNPRQEKFAQEVAAGRHFKEAYQLAGYKAKPNVAEVNGSRLAKSPKVKARIDELRAKQGAKSEMTRDQLREYLVDVLLTPAGDVDAKHKLVQAWRKSKKGQEVKVPDKLRAAELLSRLCGWLAPEKVHVEAGDKLASLMARIRKGDANGN